MITTGSQSCVVSLLDGAYAGPAAQAQVVHSDGQDKKVFLNAEVALTDPTFNLEATLLAPPLSVRGAGPREQSPPPSAPRHASEPSDGQLARCLLEVLVTLLEAIGTPALILNGGRAIVKANSAARRQFVWARVGALPRNAREQDLEETWALEPIAVTGNTHSCGWQLATVRDQSGDVVDKEYVSTACVRWKLTRRQSEVLKLVVRGMANASIGDLLGLRIRTVEFHVTKIFDKVGVDGRVALIAAVMKVHTTASTTYGKP